MSGMGTSGADQPATEGRGYGQEDITAPGDANSLLPAETTTGSVAVVADQNNNGIIYLGWDSEVTTADGFPLTAGSSISIDLDADAQNIWFLGDTAGDTIAWIATN